VVTDEGWRVLMPKKARRLKKVLLNPLQQKTKNPSSRFLT
jgi:hypothetical protein